MSDTVKVNVSAKWLRHRFNCTLDFIRSTCKGSCCQRSSKAALIALLQDEEEIHKALGYRVENHLLMPKDGTKLCPHQQADGLCRVHKTLQPFGCIASPFTLRKNTLIIRQRYSVMRCHGHGEQAHIVFFDSLVLLFGEAEAQRVSNLIDETDADKIDAFMLRDSYESIKYLDSLRIKQRDSESQTHHAAGGQRETSQSTSQTRK